LLIWAWLDVAPANAADPGFFGYGTKPTPEQIAGWDIDARADGSGLPDGKGTVAQGNARRAMAPLARARAATPSSPAGKER
jgi:hypothetical protein